MVSLEIRNLKKQYAQHFVLDGIDLISHEKNFIVIVGPSGCGKSTLLRILAGLDKDYDGEVFINGSDIKDLEPKALNLGMVFQNYALYPHKTIFDNIAFPLYLQRASKQVIKDEVIQVAKRLELEAELSKKPNQLSGGQRQRVALARAMVKKPKIFLLDEPLSNLDAKLRQSTRRSLRELFDSMDSTFIYVTHDQVEALTLADKIMILNKGKVEQYADPSDVYASPKTPFVAKFIGSPPANILEELASNKIIAVRAEDFFVFGADSNEIDAEMINLAILNYEYLGDHYLLNAEIVNSPKYKIAAINESRYVILKLQENEFQKLNLDLMSRVQPISFGIHHQNIIEFSE